MGKVLRFSPGACSVRGVEHYCDGAVIMDGDIHVGLESARLHLEPRVHEELDGGVE